MRRALALPSAIRSEEGLELRKRPRDGMATYLYLELSCLRDSVLEIAWDSSSNASAPVHLARGLPLVLSLLNNIPDSISCSLMI